VRPAAQTAALPEPISPRKGQRPSAERKSARIVQLNGANADDVEKQRLRLLDRFLVSEGRGAISRAANEYRQAGFQFPEEQEVQLKLLEHFDETHARTALDTLSKLLEQESPLQRPVLEMRLRRLEEYAEDPQTREIAGVLRRAIR
jgi:predicted ATPase